jgi:dUTPase
LVQLIPRQFLHLEAVEVEELDTTERGEGGFGSSG